jgi:transcriptional regulator with XRE-family HTH domain
MTLGERIKRQRLRLGLTQAELSSLAQIPRPRITELETNRRMQVSSEVIPRLARALQCTADYLVGMYEEETDGTLWPPGMAMRAG